MSDSRVHTGREVMPEGTMSLRVGHRADWGAGRQSCHIRRRCVRSL